MFKTTIKELSERLEVSYASALGLVKFLEEKELAKDIGRQKEEGQKGKGSTIWEISDGANDGLLDEFFK